MQLASSVRTRPLPQGVLTSPCSHGFCLLSRVFLQPATIHHHQHPGVLRASGCGFINYALLQPNRPGADRDRFVNSSASFTRPTKYINEVYFVRNVSKLRVSLVSKNFCLVRIDGDYFVTAASHVRRHAIRRTTRI
jgi:hypothetical protein